MSTDRQRAANRRNAQRSTGPRTTRGRAAVRSNHLQHGFYGRVAIPDFEDTAGYHAVLDDYLADLHPAGAVETELVHRLVMELWKLRRLEHLEKEGRRKRDVLTCPTHNRLNSQDLKNVAPMVALPAWFRQPSPHTHSPQ